MAKIVNIALRAFQFFWTLVIMALVGNMIADSGSGPSIVNYSMFVAVFAMLTLFYLGFAAFTDSTVIHPMLPLVFDALNVIFWFCGAVAFAAELRVHSCSDQGYLNSNIITRGSSKRCREGQATTAFLWFGFAAFVASLAFSAMGARSGGSSGIRRGPAMSQV
ncbi:Hypothetical protein R9X50_00429000 [Acrodontium crateriforme]|uniref:MARVEL domain-containing protein n=1 Tax=Acrodontium crateriforme TaxID=150365 RepID=A0AAQ3M4G0_9PEZI|nr:Hypothetical protein R9X50_00429000 [Acrodontium crateriforme]